MAAEGAGGLAGAAMGSAMAAQGAAASAMGSHALGAAMEWKAWAKVKWVKLWALCKKECQEQWVALWQVQWLGSSWPRRYGSNG